MLSSFPTRGEGFQEKSIYSHGGFIIWCTNDSESDSMIKDKIGGPPEQLAVTLEVRLDLKNERGGFLCFQLAATTGRLT